MFRCLAAPLVSNIALQNELTSGKEVLGIVLVPTKDNSKDWIR